MAPFEPVEHPFDTIAVEVSEEIAGNVLCAVQTWRDDGQDIPKLQVLPYSITVMSFVCQKPAGG